MAVTTFRMVGLSSMTRTRFDMGQKARFSSGLRLADGARFSLVELGERDGEGGFCALKRRPVRVPFRERPVGPRRFDVERLLRRFEVLSRGRRVDVEYSQAFA